MATVHAEFSPPNIDTFTDEEKAGRRSLIIRPFRVEGFRRETRGNINSLGGKNMDNGKKLMTGLVAGALVGAVAGMLLAPKSGKENRKMVGEKAGKIRNRTGGAIGSLKSRMKKTPTETAVEEPSNNGAHVLN
jgi:hypothetical protein